MKSLWIDTVKMPEFPRLDGDVKTDVLVIGGGLAGLLTTYMLTRAGIGCLLIEAGQLCSGTSANTTAKITSQHGLIYHKLVRQFGADRARMYFQVNEQALGLYQTLCRSVSCGFEQQDNYVYSVDRPEKLEREVRALDRLNIPHEYVKKPELPIQTVGAIRFRDQAQFHPLEFAAEIARGLNIRTNTRALAYEEGCVSTGHGIIRAKNIVVTTHFPLFNKHGSYFLKLYQHRSYVLALEGAEAVNGMYVDEAKSGFSFRNADGLLLLGGGSHRTGKQGGGWAQLRSMARQHYPDAQEKYHWGAQDCMSLDGIPYIGRYSAATPNLYVATGFNKWGMTSSMVAAKILCTMIKGEKVPYGELFSPSRTMLRPQLLLNMVESAVNLLTPTKPRCPHMGCALKWNRQEHTWDCPCHGSRFDSHGTVLENPANGDMHL